MMKGLLNMAKNKQQGGLAVAPLKKPPNQLAIPHHLDLEEGELMDEEMEEDYDPT